MDIVTVRRRFEAYSSGTSSAAELRMAVVDAVRIDPRLAEPCSALAAGYFETGSADQGLRDTILADIASLAATARASAGQGGPEPEPPAPDRRTMLRPQRRVAPAAEPEPVSPEGEDVVRASSSDESEWARGSATEGMHFSAVDDSSFGTGTGTGTSGSDWGAPERLNEPAVALEVGSVLNGRYELEEELARGGMGIVFRALDLQNSELGDRSSQVAIKVLGDEFKRHPLAIKALAREAKKSLKLAHPNIVTVHKFARDGGNVFIVMELLEGRSLDQVLRSEGEHGLPLPRVTNILQGLGEALSYAHEQGIVHADFKPSNAFITNDGVVKVLDFGIARAAQSGAKPDDKTLFDVSQLNAISPAYASLEMHNGEPPDPRDDIYSLACVTYELLTGRHPYNRIDAAKARQANLQPAPIRSLPGAQWRALRQSLAFERAMRTASVAEFVAAFMKPPRSKLRIGAIALVVVAAIAAFYLVPRQLESNRAHQVAAAIAAATPEAMPALLAKLRTESQSFRDRVLLADKAREATLGFYQAQLTGLIAAPRLEFAAAQNKLNELRQLLPDSNAVLTMSQNLGAGAAVELARLMSLRDHAVQRGVLIPDQGPDSLVEVLTVVRGVDPAEKALTDPSVPQLYYAAGKAALDAGNADLALTLAAAGVSIAPNDGTLLDLQERADREVARLANARKQAELEHHLASLNPASSEFLDKVLANREDVAALAAIAPESPVVKRIESSLDAVVALRVKQRLAAEDVAGARALLLDLGDLMPETAVSVQRDLIAKFAAASQAKSFDTLERLRRAVLSGRLDKTGSTGAQDLYAQLQRSGASSDLQADARDYLAYGYLKDARKARFAGDSARAGAQLDVGTKLQPNATLQKMLAAEQKELDAGASKDAAVAQSKLDAARNDFAQALRSPSLGTAELARLALALDHLESVGAPSQEIASCVSQVEDRVLAEERRLKQQAGADPQQLAQQAALMLPWSDRLADATKEFRDADVAADVKKRLDALLRQPTPTEQWAADVKDLLQQLRGLVPVTDPAFSEARRLAADTFQQAANEARATHRPKDEKTLMATARDFDPAIRGVAEVQPSSAAPRAKPQAAGAPAASTAADAASAAEQAAANKSRQEAIDALKQRLESQSAAGDVGGAAKTATSLRTVLAGDVYVVRDVPRLMVSAYVNHAQSQFAAGKVHDAVQTLAAGARQYVDAPEIKSLQARYAQAEAAVGSAAPH